MNGTIYVEWSFNDDPRKPDYYGYGEIDGVRVKVTGDIEPREPGMHRRAKLIIRESTNQRQR